MVPSPVGWRRNRHDLGLNYPVLTVYSLTDEPLAPGIGASLAFDAACYGSPNPFGRRSPCPLTRSGKPLFYPRCSSEPTSLWESRLVLRGAILRRLRPLSRSLAFSRLFRVKRCESSLIPTESAIRPLSSPAVRRVEWMSQSLTRD